MSSIIRLNYLSSSSSSLFLLIVKIRFLLIKIVPIRILIILRRSFSVAGLVLITLILFFKEDYLVRKLPALLLSSKCSKYSSFI
jgi:hypothetical protein